MWFNPLIILLLKSPLHPLLSNETMLLTYYGIKTGRKFQVPVNFVRCENLVYTISFRQRKWWRNFLQVYPVELLIAGEKIPAKAWAVTDVQEAANLLSEMVGVNPVYARYLEIRLDQDGKPDPDDILQAVDDRIVVKFQLETTESDRENED